MIDTQLQQRGEAWAYAMANADQTFWPEIAAAVGNRTALEVPGSYVCGPYFDQTKVSRFVRLQG
jgi:hypothetical protein